MHTAKQIKSLEYFGLITAGLDVVSAKKAVEIERLTAGKITRVMLRPVLFESCVPYE